MVSYKDSSIWHQAFLRGNTQYKELRENLIEIYEHSRLNAVFLLDKIRQDFPNLTVHDISHVDGLWRVSSVITGAEYEINPLEGFILGCAFLMHDAVLSYTAIGGKARLRATTAWLDYYEDTRAIAELTDEQREFETDFRALRFLHAKEAEQLYQQSFTRDNGTSFYIIDDDYLRNHLGQTICRIACSHHWNTDRLAELGTQLPAPAMYPVEWRINPLKLACILRCADAGHIDDGRAPDYLLKVLKINGVSREHWSAQNKLSQIDIDSQDNEKVRIESNIDFKEEDFSAWNVACDAVQVLNHELQSVDELFRRNSCPRFKVKGVIGSESRESLSRYIKTVGWQPCDATIHISNVEGLIHSIGGENLYGKENSIEVVLRELLQNARDSIAARRKLDVNFDGEIRIKIQDIDGNIWIEVSDNGVGMSLQTIKDYLLNFGSSFWASDLAKVEYPGLASSGFKSVGKFGIGFLFCLYDCIRGNYKYQKI